MLELPNRDGVCEAVLHTLGFIYLKTRNEIAGPTRIVPGLRVAFFLAALLACMALVACGGGGTVTPPPSGPFSNASLKGQYAYTMSGLDPNGAYFARAGSFTADGNGNLTGGLEDALNLSAGEPASTIAFTGGTYQVQSNGRVEATLTGANGLQLPLSLMMQSSSQGFLLETDLNAVCGGTFFLQTSSDFTASALGNPYVFDLSGVSFSGGNAAPIAMVGKLSGDGNGAITGGVMDTNDGNGPASSGATPIAPGTYALDTNGNGTNFGRGMMEFNGHTFAFYIVDATHFKLIEEDSLGGSTGDALQQSPGIPTQNGQFTGSFVYMVQGFAVVGPQGPVDLVARFTADGNGGLGAITQDINNDGRYSHISGNISAATYAMDTANSGSGRGEFTFTSGSSTFSNVFYLISPSQGAVLATSPGLVGSGPIYAQTGGPFSVSGSVGSYVTNWTGVQLGSTTAVPIQEAFVGQYALSNATSSNIAGVTDYVQLGVSTKNVNSNIVLSGTLMMQNDSTANNLYKFVLNGSTSVTVNFQAYFVNPGMAFLVCSDNLRTLGGVVTQQ